MPTVKTQFVEFYNKRPMSLRQILTIALLFCCLNVFGQQANRVTLQGVNTQVQVFQDSLDNLNQKILELQDTNDDFQHQLERMDREVALYREDVRTKVSEINSELALWLTILTIIMAIVGIVLGVVAPILINRQNDKNLKEQLTQLTSQVDAAKKDALSAKQSLGEITQLKNEVTKIKQDIDKSKEATRRAAKRTEANKYFAQALSAAAENDQMKAIDLYTKVIELFPDNSDAYNNRGAL